MQGFRHILEWKIPNQDDFNNVVAFVHSKYERMHSVVTEQFGPHGWIVMMLFAFCNDISLILVCKKVVIDLFVQIILFRVICRVNKQNLGGKYSIRLTPEGHMPQEAIDITRNKIRTIFRIGLLYGHDSLVLGAFGCGAFRNPPEEMARLFHEVMEEPEFKDRYRLITFSIIDDHNARNANLAAFRAELSDEMQVVHGF